MDILTPRELDEDRKRRLNFTGVIAVVGTGRSGKTATVHYLFEQVFRDRRKCFYRIPSTIGEHLPEDGNFGIIESIQEVEERDVVLIDDAALTASARTHSSKGNVQWTNALTIVSHWDVVIIITIENVRLLDVLFSSVQNFTLIQKLSDLENLRLTRPEFKRSLLTGQAVMGKILQRNPDLDPRSLAFFHDNYRTYRVGLAEWWSDELSRPYREYRFDDLEDLRI